MHNTRCTSYIILNPHMNLWGKTCSDSPVSRLQLYRCSGRRGSEELWRGPETIKYTNGIKRVETNVEY